MQGGGAHRIAPNLLARNFTAEAPNRVWVTDITCIWTLQGWLFLSVILDLFSRRIVGWAMSKNIDEGLILGALRMALLNRKPKAGLFEKVQKVGRPSGLGRGQ